MTFEDQLKRRREDMSHTDKTMSEDTQADDETVVDQLQIAYEFQTNTLQTIKRMFGESEQNQEDEKASGSAIRQLEKRSRELREQAREINQKLHKLLEEDLGL